MKLLEKLPYPPPYINTWWATIDMTTGKVIRERCLSSSIPEKPLKGRPTAVTGRVR